jgi:adenosine kinase
MPKNKKTILVSGSLVYDRIMDFPGYFKDHIMPDKIHILNVSFAVNGLKESFGGTAGNIAYNLSLLGERPSILACVGNNFSPYKKWLVKNKIDVSQIKTIKDKQTSSCYITTDKADNQITAFNPGALACENYNVETRQCLVSTGTIAIISPGNNRDMENYAAAYKRAGIKYIFDPGQQITALSPAVLKKCINGAEVLIGNDYEVSLIMKKIGWTQNKIIDKVGILIITKGENGSAIYKRQIPPTPFTKGGAIQGVKIPAVKLKKVIDPTGAGDAYRAGLIKGMIDNMPLEKAGRLASVVASFAVEKQGTQEHRFSWGDIKDRYYKNYKEKYKN